MTLLVSLHLVQGWKHCSDSSGWRLFLWPWKSRSWPLVDSWWCGHQPSAIHYETLGWSPGSAENKRRQSALIIQCQIGGRADFQSEACFDSELAFFFNFHPFHMMFILISQGEIEQLVQAHPEMFADFFITRSSSSQSKLCSLTGWNLCLISQEEECITWQCGLTNIDEKWQ